MTFMLSNVRSAVAVYNDVEQHSSSGTKRKSLSFLSSSPAKLKRVERSSLSLLSTSSKRSRPSHKSPPTCTISLENVTVNVRDEHKVTPPTTPLESIDVNIIPFPTTTSEESELCPPPIGRRRRSNHLLGHRRSSSVHSISPQYGKENPSLSAFSSQPTTPKKPKCSPKGPSSPLAKSSLSFKDIRFIALIRRSIMNGVIWRERMDRMDVDSSSGSVTFDILNESDEPSEARFMHDQDILLANRLGKQLADWGYRERDLPISSTCPLRMPLAPVALPAVTVCPPFSHTADSKPSMPSLPSAAIISTPNLQRHAIHVSFLDDVENIPMDVDVDRPERPVSPVARCLEPMHENNAPISSIVGSEHLRKPLVHSIPYFDPPLTSELDDSHELALPGHHIRVPTPISSSPPVSTFSPGPHSSQQRVFSASQLVATLVMRHREKTTLRGTPQVGNRAAGRGMRRPSPLACELWALAEN